MTADFVEDNFVFYFVLLSGSIMILSILLGTVFSVAFGGFGFIFSLSVVIGHLAAVIIPLTWDGYWRFVRRLKNK